MTLKLSKKENEARISELEEEIQELTGLITEHESNKEQLTITVESVSLLEFVLLKACKNAKELEEVQEKKQELEYTIDGLKDTIAALKDEVEDLQKTIKSVVKTHSLIFKLIA